MSGTRGTGNKSRSIFRTVLSQPTTRIAYTCAKNSIIQAYPRRPPTSASFLRRTRLLWLHGRTWGLCPSRTAHPWLLMVRGLRLPATSMKRTSSCTWFFQPDPSQDCVCFPLRQTFLTDLNERHSFSTNTYTYFCTSRDADLEVQVSLVQVVQSNLL